MTYVHDAGPDDIHRKAKACHLEVPGPVKDSYLNC